MPIWHHLKWGIVAIALAFAGELWAADRPGGGPPEPTISISPEDAVQVTGFVGDAGIDTDGDGWFDALEVRVEVRTTRAGEYTQSAQILDADNNDIEFPGQKGLELAAGSNVVSLRFDGRKIAATGKNGPFRVRNYSIYLSGNHHLMGYTTDEYRTSAYLNSAFAPSDELAIRERYPNENERDVPVTVTIRLGFSVPLDQRTLTGETVSLRTARGVVVSSSLALDQTGRVVRLVPDSPLEPAQAYLIMVSNKLQGREGKSLTRFYTWSFVTSPNPGK